MILTRTDWLGWGLKPYMYCMPVIKNREGNRDALRKAATSGAPLLFPRHRFGPRIQWRKKLSVNGYPGPCSTRRSRSRTYAKVFEEEDALDNLEAFASLNGPAPTTSSSPTAKNDHAREESPGSRPEEVKVDGPDEKGPWSIAGGEKDRMESGGRLS